MMYLTNNKQVLQGGPLYGFFWSGGPGGGPSILTSGLAMICLIWSAALSGSLTRVILRSYLVSV